MSERTEATTDERPVAPGAEAPAPVPTTGDYVLVRLGPWPVPMNDRQLRMMDAHIARARARQLPFCSILDETRRECVAFIVEPLPHVVLTATGDVR